MGGCCCKHDQACDCNKCKRQAKLDMGIAHGIMIDYADHYMRTVEQVEAKLSPKELTEFRRINGIAAPRIAPADVDLTRYDVEGRSPVCEERNPGEPKRAVSIFVSVDASRCGTLPAIVAPPLLPVTPAGNASV